MTVQETFENFILSRKLADLSRKTITDYTQFVTPLIASLGSERDFQTIRQADINVYLGSLIERPLSMSTRATYIRHAKIYLRWCEIEYGALYNSKNIKVPKSPKRNVKIYSDSEVYMLFDSIEAELPWLTLRNKCIVALMYDSGLRQSEVCTLQKNRISYSDNHMIVWGKGD